jgi:hypothetical protein
MSIPSFRQQYLVRILGIGFSLVILLLAAASGLSVYRAQLRRIGKPANLLLGTDEQATGGAAKNRQGVVLPAGIETG